MTQYLYRFQSGILAPRWLAVKPIQIAPHPRSTPRSIIWSFSGIGFRIVYVSITFKLVFPVHVPTCHRTAIAKPHTTAERAVLEPARYQIEW